MPNMANRNSALALVAVAVVFAVAGVACVTATGRVHRHLHRSHVHSHHSIAREQHVLQPTAESVAGADANVHANAHASVGVNKALDETYTYPLLYGEPADGKTGVAPITAECAGLTVDFLKKYKLPELQGEDHRMFGVMVTKRKNDQSLHAYVAMSGNGKYGTLANDNGKELEATVGPKKGTKYTIHVYDDNKPDRPLALTQVNGAGGIPYPAPDDGVCSARYGWSGAGADGVVQYTPSPCTADELEYLHSRDALLVAMAKLHAERTTVGHAVQKAWSDAHKLMTDGDGQNVKGLTALNAELDTARQQRRVDHDTKMQRLTGKQRQNGNEHQALENKLKQPLALAQQTVDAHSKDRNVKIDVAALKRLLTDAVVTTAAGRVNMPVPTGELSPQAVNRVKNVPGNQKNIEEQKEQHKLKLAIIEWFEKLLTAVRGDAKTAFDASEKEIAEARKSYATEGQTDNDAYEQKRKALVDAFVHTVKGAINGDIHALSTAAKRRIDQALRAHPDDPFHPSNFPPATGSLTPDTDNGYPYGACAGSKLSFMAAQLRQSQHDIVCVAERWTNPNGQIPVAQFNSHTLEQWGPTVPSCATCRQVMRHFLNARPL